MERNLVLPAQPPCLETDVFEAEKTQPYLEAKLYIERIEQESKKCQDEKRTDTTHEPLEGLEPLEHGVSLTMYPVRVPNVHFSCATVQWDMPQTLTDDPSADSACMDELNSSGGASLDWTINPLSSETPRLSQENVTELIQEKEIGQLDTEVEVRSGPARTVENNDNSCQTCDQDTVENIFVTPSYEDSQELLKEDKVDIGLKTFENNPDRTESSICTEKIQMGFENSETQTEEERKQLRDTTPNLTQPKQVLGDLCKDKESMCLYLTYRDETDNVNNGGMCQMGNMDHKGDQTSTYQSGTSCYLEQEPDLVGESDQTLLDGVTNPPEPADQQPNCICDVSMTVEATDQTIPKQDLIELLETKQNSVQPILVTTLDIISDEKLQTEQLQSAETFQKMKGSAWAICEDQTESSVEMKHAEQSECSTRLELSEQSDCSDEVEQSKQPNSQHTEQSIQLSNELKPECSIEPSEVPEIPKETQPSDQSNQLESSSEISEDSKVPKEMQPSEQSTQSGCSEDDDPSEQPVQSECSEDDDPSEQPVQSECSNQTEPLTLSHLQDSEPTQESAHPDQQGNEQQIHIEVKHQNEDKEPSACEDHSEHTEHRSGSIEQPERQKQESVALVVPCENSKVEVVDREEAKRLAEKLYKLENVQRTDVVRHLDKDNEFSRAVGEEYLNFFDFTDQSLDEALRSFLLEVVLIGETQERERVLERFSGRYHQCNPSSYSSPGSVLTLTCAVMLLNTDIHGQNVGKAMSSTDFVSNLDGMNEGENFSKDLLKTLYNSIKNHPLEWAVEEQVLVKSMILEQDSDQDSTLRSKSNPFQDLAHDKKATVFQKGFLKRKAHADIDGKRTPWGKRSWKTFYAVLKGMVLYLQKDEYRKDWQSSEEVLSVHHSLAERAEDYTKRPYVFRLQTADWRVFLFEAASTEQMNSWIGRINLVSALYSSPPFPAAVGSQRRFCRPILPATQSTLSLEKQLQSHAAMLQSFQEDLSALQQGAPESRKAKARDLEDHRHKEEYLQHERCRYEAYVQILEVWQRLGKTSEMDGGTDLALFDQELWKGLAIEVEDPDETDGGMKRSHSSPSLELELAPPPVVKVRRNISERRTYRKIIVPRRNKEL